MQSMIDRMSISTVMMYLFIIFIGFIQEANLAVQRELSELRIASARLKYNTAPPAVQELLEQLAEQKRITKAEVMCTNNMQQNTDIQ
jgi:hypothetical protein